MNNLYNRKTSGCNLWKKSIKLMLDWNGLFSKISVKYASFLWSTYFNKAKGNKLTDLNGVAWKDFSQMGLGFTIFGCSNSELNKFEFNMNSVKDVIDNLSKILSLKKSKEKNLTDKIILNFNKKKYHSINNLIQKN